MFTKWSLTYLNQSSLLVPEFQPAPAVNNLQTVQGNEEAKTADAANATDTAKRDAYNMEAEAELKRNIEDSDDEWTDASKCSDQKDFEEVQEAETGDKPKGKTRVRRREKKEVKEKGQRSKQGRK